MRGCYKNVGCVDLEQHLPCVGVYVYVYSYVCINPPWLDLRIRCYIGEMCFQAHHYKTLSPAPRWSVERCSFFCLGMGSNSSVSLITI